MQVEDIYFILQRSSESCIKKSIHYFNSCAFKGLAFIVFIFFGCNKNLNDTIDIYPKHFKIVTPFIIDSRGIIINTYWGSARKHYVLCIDNYSPSWIKNSVINFDKSFVKLKDLSFKTSTGDKTPVRGDVGVCDSIYFGDVIFKNVPFYVMPDNTKDTKTSDGVLGEEAMAKGIWKIDFVKNELTFTSDVDSLDVIKQSEIFSATFKQQSIFVDVDFGNGNEKKLAIDLGYNRYMLISPTDFKSISLGKQTFSNIEQFSTPASASMVNNYSLLDTVKIQHNWFVTEISSNEKVTESVIGLAFFKKFDYVIFDFINHHIYIPKKVW